MRRLVFFTIMTGITGVIAAMAAPGCSTRGGADEQTPMETDGGAAPVAPVAVADDDLAAVVDGNTEFAIDLYRYFQGTEDGNVFFSPYSISTAFGMTQVGARHETEAQIRATMHFPLPNDTLHPALGVLAGRLQDASGEDAPIDLDIANRLWGDQDEKFLPEFLETVSAHYAGGFEALNFADKEAARKRINDWVSDQTREKIPELLKPDHMRGRVVLVLTNAIYFKGNWQKQFKTQMTRDGKFFPAPGTSVTSSMMNQTDEFPFFESDLLQALELPYEGDRLSMVLLLPKERNNLKAIEDVMTHETLSGWMDGLQERKVRVSMPKFRMRFARELTDALTSMGMGLAFSPSADFSGFTGVPDLFITAVAHEAYVDVNEEGTEAAAATGVVVGRASVPQIPTFRADHPFIFLIRDRETGAILFMGRVVDPTEGNRDA